MVMVVTTVALVVMRAVQLPSSVKKNSSPPEQRREQALRAGLRLERLRQHVQQRGAQQHAGRQADQALHQARSIASVRLPR